MSNLYFCCGANCPGLTYRASDTAHPSTCAGLGAIDQDALLTKIERLTATTAVRVAVEHLAAELVPVVRDLERRLAEAEQEARRASAVEHAKIVAFLRTRLGDAPPGPAYVYFDRVLAQVGRGEHRGQP